MLTHLQLKTDLYRMVGVDPTRPIRADILEAVRTAILNGQQSFALFGDWDFLQQYQDTVYTTLLPPYQDGTVDVTQDSKTITGTGTAWTKDMEGSYFRLTGMEVYEIRRFISPTSLELAMPYQSASAALQSYFILKRFYPMPLDFLRVDGTEAQIAQPGSNSREDITWNKEAVFEADLTVGKPCHWAIQGNSPRGDYFNTGTVAINGNTWTISSGVLPTDIVDREVQVRGEDRAYRISARTGNTTFTTYNNYVNPTNLTAILAAGAYAITPEYTQLVALDYIADRRYILEIPYIRKLPELLLDSDISPVSLAGYDRALKFACRYELSLDARVAMRGDAIKSLAAAKDEAMGEAWAAEQFSGTKEEMAQGYTRPDTQAGPSWL